MTKNNYPRTRVRHAASRCLLIVLLSGVVFPRAIFAQSGVELLPNLRALPAYDIVVEENFGGVLEMRFTASIWNSGDGPLELIAGEVAQGQQYVRQRVYDDQGLYQEHLAGKFVWHPGHDHFHFEDFALYRLQAVRGNSKRDSAKTSFCVMDSAVVDGSLPGSPGRPIYENCGNFFQGVSVGWMDEYTANLPGQSFDLTRLKDGDYRLIIDADPRNRLLETDDNDNSSCVLLRLSVTQQTVDILNPDSCDEGGSEPPPPPGGETTVVSITPDTARVGETISVLIDGTGFAEGMQVAFDNGKGDKPLASEVIVLSAEQIQATVTIRKRGGDSDPVWDLVVGTARLADAFTVLQ